ncbi:hypothetical protein FHS82_001311 [Pseudochelatococcus lubricantis]|uniref:Uncharacterized protein n=1 Tax=Pseudochelatococcus lubricantis TaxID=1538102 RepID=A0ABX0UZT9_9HYPH|nr:hypothetical protein [Pseudochelatococcus lubricantis]NIJ57485.1 hypothetical protein [Pseudochelatococcus lubricantis]
MEIAVAATQCGAGSGRECADRVPPDTAAETGEPVPTRFPQSGTHCAPAGRHHALNNAFYMKPVNPILSTRLAPNFSRCIIYFMLVNDFCRAAENARWRIKFSAQSKI